MSFAPDQPDAPNHRLAAGPARPAISERRLIFLVGAIQFVNILDFMMVMPLGPDFAAALGIPTSNIGLVGGSYTLAAACAGVAGSLFLDRFDRRSALAVAMLGLVTGTAAGGFATGLGTLLGARVIAGCFGGPATSLSLALIADGIPPERRGKAMGAVMGAFSVAAVLGVPAGLELARLGGWRTPFFAVSALGLVVAAAALFVMPPMRGHLERLKAQPGSVPGLFDSITLLALATTAVATLGTFAIVPNISAFVQHNLGYPRAHLGVLYLVGGAVSFAMMRVVGRLVDRFGATPLVITGSLLHVLALELGFIHPSQSLPVLAVFTLFMLSASVRMVPLSSLSTRVPRPEQRARFMSTQSAVQHSASAVGAFTASLFLSASPDGKLVGMDRVAAAAVVAALCVPLLAHLLEVRVKARELLTARPTAEP